MLRKFFTIVITCAMIYFPASTMSNISKVGQISDIITNIMVYDKRILQLQVNWNDTLPKDTMYNVIVKPLNMTEGVEMPCSMYGISKPDTSLLMPQNPMTYVEDMDCSYMPGSNYTLTVETSNAAVSKTVPVSIPYCVEDICSCQHATELPPVLANVTVATNHTVDVSWRINIEHMGHEKTTYSEPTLSSIYIKLSKQMNPSLSWGGLHKPLAEELFALNKTHISMTSRGWMEGSRRIELSEMLPPKNVLFLRTYVMDTLRCAGPEKIVKVEVRVQNAPALEALQENDVDLRVGLIVVTSLFVFVIISALALFIWRRQKAKYDTPNEKDEQFFTPLAEVIDKMEDNINYVDKYIEDAQVKGLADLFEVPHHAIQMGPEIGEGAFGRVYKATATNIRRMRGVLIVAVKQLKKNPTSDEVGEFLTEIEMLKGVGTHNNIVSFMGCCTIRPPYLMIMQYVGRGDLLSYLRIVRQEASKFRTHDANVVVGREQEQQSTVPVSYIELKVSEESIYDEAEEARRPKPSVAETTYTIMNDDDAYGGVQSEFQYILSHKELHNFAMQIANGMRFLEEQEITHRDLAARNVLIDDQKTLKISDFGLSRHGIYTNTKTRKLPLRWLSIEAIRDNIYSNKSDVWAYGVVLWEIGTLGASPYPTISNNELIPFLLSGQRLDKPEICTDEVYKIMQQCWLEDPIERPDFAVLHNILSPKTTYVDLNSLSDDYVFPPI